MKRKHKARIEELERRVRELEARPLPPLQPIYVPLYTEPPRPFQPYRWEPHTWPIITCTTTAAPLVTSGTVSPLNVSPVSAVVDVRHVTAPWSWT